MEKIPAAFDELWKPEEIEEELTATQPELLQYFRLLPRSLWGQHFDQVQKISLDTENAHELRINYILGIVESREKAITSFGASDPIFEKFITESPEAFGATMREVLLATGNTLGAGMTARVKSARINGFDTPIAIKYLLTPTEKTLSVDGEYDMIREVETVQHIEDAEHKLGAGEHVRVPHPHFYFKRGKIQCYGMSQVRGMNIKEFVEGTHAPLVRDRIAASLRSRFDTPQAEARLVEEIGLFMKAVHEVCLHGDIKLANVMVDEDGVLYLIDFGQSVLANNMSEKTRDQFENLQTEERLQLVECARALFNALREHSVAQTHIAA